MVDFLVTMPLGIPAVVFGVGFLLTYTREPFVLYGTPWVIVLVYVTLMLPFTTRMQLAGMVALGNNYLEASRASGAGALRTNVNIVLPLLRADHRWGRGADVRAAHPRVRRLAARAVADHPGDGHRAVRLLHERLVPDWSPPSP